MQKFRVAGGAIDRSQLLRFEFNGRPLQGYRGDTLASALLANGVRLVGRSFKYHRPRGIFSAGSEEPNAIVQLGQGAHSEPNLKATQVELVDGLVARSVNCWPSPRFDLRSVNQLAAALMPAGFYYKTFMRPDWHLFEGTIRRAAGLGTAPKTADPDRYDHLHASVDVLVVGGGPAGLAAAHAAALGGARVMLADDQASLGGSLLWRGRADRDAEAVRSWMNDTIADLERMPNVTVLTRTIVSGYYDHDAVVAVERRVGDAVRQRLWQLRARQVLLATGATERPLVFPGNDSPGVMLADAALRYLRQFAVRCGERAVVFANNSDAYRAALELQQAGLEVAAIVDPAPQPKHRAFEEARAAGIDLYPGSVVEATQGRHRLRGVTVAGPHGREHFSCDLLCVSGGWSPNVQLHSQSGGSVAFDEPRGMFVPDRAVQATASIGSANGTLTLGAALQEAVAAGVKAAQAVGFASRAPTLPALHDEDEFTLHPLWSPAAGSGKAFVDLASDVTADDVALAARENYVSVEHLKRYTTLGMSVDQGRTSNVNGLAIMGELTNRRPPQVGTTRFRPPFSPITLGAVAGPRVGELFRPLKYLPAHDWHVARGAAFEEFGGWLRPTAYLRAGEDWEAAALREARAVRNSVGLFDGSPLGKIEVIGPDAATFLDRIYLETASSLAVGRTRYGLMLNDTGVVMDDGVFARLTPLRFLVHTTSAGAERINEWLESWLQRDFPDLDVVIVPVTTQWATLAVSGPRARDVLCNLNSDIDWEPAAFPHMSVREGRIEGIAARVCRISFTGELSYEINVPARSAPQLIDHLWKAGQEFGIAPYGVEALMTLRAEKGYLHVGVDSDGTTLPGDLGKGTAVARKISDFSGRRSLTQANALSAQRLQLVGLSSDERLPAGAQIMGGSASQASDGHVTTSVFSPALSKPIALALVRNGRNRMNEQVTVFHMGRKLRASIVSTVFFDAAGERLNG